MIRKIALKGNHNVGLSRPSQRIPESQKDSEQFKIANVDYWLGRGTLSSSMKAEMRRLYRAANGSLISEDYDHVLYPLGKEQRTREELQGDPAQLRNYDIIGPTISRIVGDYMMRDTDFTVVATNSRVEEERLEFQKQKIKEKLLKQVRLELKQMGIDSEIEGDSQTPIPTLDEIKIQASQVPDRMTARGQKAIDYIRYQQEMDRKLRLAVWDYITVGRICTYRDVYRDEVCFDILSPIDVDFIAGPQVEFIEDAESAKYSTYMTYSEIIDKFPDLEKEDLKYIEENYRPGFTGEGYEQVDSDEDKNWSMAAMKAEVLGRVFGQKNATRDAIPVEYVCWRSQRELGRLRQWDIFGNEIESIEVTRDFKPRPDEQVEWIWVDQVWEGYRIADVVYHRIRPIPVQRGTINNPSSCKLPINGRIFGNRTNVPNTPVKRAMPFQQMHNIVKYRLERVLAKNKDKLVLFPYGLVPDTKEFDMFSMMYYADYHGWLFFDESDPKKLAAFNAIKVLDASLQQYIKFLYDISVAIRQEMLENIGMPRQKMADVKSSDTVGGTEAAIVNSGLIFEEMFVSIEELIERDYNALLDLSKYAWIEGKKAAYMNTKGEHHMFEIDDVEDYAATDFTIFVKGNKSEKEKLRTFQNLVQAFAQNEGRPREIAAIIKANNFSSLMDELDAMEERIAGEAQQQQQSINEVEMAKVQAQQQELELKKYEIDANNQTKIEVAEIAARSRVMGQVVQTAGFPDGSEIERGDIDTAMESVGVSVDMDKNNVAREKIQADREKAKIDLEIAKTNKNKYDK